MIKNISINELNGYVSLVCSFCGQSFNKKKDKEGKEYSFQRDEETGDEWCICKECSELNKLSKKCSL